MALLNILFYFVLPALVAGYLFLKKKYRYFEERNIPFVAPSSLLMGNMGDVGKKIHMTDFMRRQYNESKDKGGICGYFTSFVPTILVTDLELVKHVTVKDFHNFADRGMYVNEEVESLTGNMFSVDGEKWKYLRNKLSPAFTSGKMKMMYHTISDKGDKFVEAIEKASKNGSVDIKNIASRFTVDVISSCAFGIEASTLTNENPEMVGILKKILGEDGVSQLKFFFLSSFPNFSKFFKLRFFEIKVTEFFENIVGGSMKYREDNNVTRKDFLNMLIEMKNKGSIEGEISTDLRKLTMDECVAQAFIFFLGGSDTSSTAIAFTLLELGCHLEIQDKLRKEIMEKTKDSNGEITYDNLHEMTYLNQVVNESLRMYTPAPFMFRQAIEDYTVLNSRIVIEKGTQVIIPAIGIHYDEEYWTKPEEFNPDRFSPEETAKRPNMAFIPFGNGPRNCIGMRFGLINTAFAVATVVKNFKVTLDSSKTPRPFTLSTDKFGLEPKGGSWLKLEKI